jgi:hypothetical protein
LNHNATDEIPTRLILVIEGNAIKIYSMEMNKNTVLAWATFIMIFFGFVLIALGAFKYDDVAGWGFASVGIGFLANAWVFNALKGRV